MPSYAVQLAQRLVRCPSVTPVEGGALDLLQDELTKLGFDCTRLPFGTGAKRIDNLFARRGKSGPHFAFAGHTDVVPVGDASHWQHDPFGGTLVDGKLYGRGTADMKGGIAAFVAAVTALDGAGDAGSISFIITGDEEGDADFGTVKMVEWLQANDQVPDVCVVGEPTNPSRLGDVIKNGRRGSLSCQLRVDGVQGHVAYPHLANNPIGWCPSGALLCGPWMRVLSCVECVPWGPPACLLRGPRACALTLPMVPFAGRHRACTHTRCACARSSPRTTASPPA